MLEGDSMGYNRNMEGCSKAVLGTGMGVASG